MFKVHFLQKSWRPLSLKCDVSLDELEKAAQAPQNPVELQKDVVWQHWKSCTIRDTLWHVRDAWKEVTATCIWRAWKKLCPNLAVDFGGLSREHFKCLELARRVGLDEVLEDDMDSLLESISEELLTEELEDLEKQRRQLEEEVEAEQHPTAQQTKQMTVEILQGFYTLLNKTLE